MDEVALLTRAREVLLEKKWIKGSLCRTNKDSPVVGDTDIVGVCSLGAMGVAEWEFARGRTPFYEEFLYSEDEYRVPEVLTDLLRKQYGIAPDGGGVDLIIDFNDHESTTLNDVLDVFDKAILAAKESACG